MAERVVVVLPDPAYQSLSAIARAITGTRWNGWMFFGLRKAGA